MKLWDISGDGRLWKVQLDVRDLEEEERGERGTLMSLIGLGLVLCLVGSRRLLLVWLPLVPCLLVFRSSRDWFEVSIFLLVYMLLRPLMCLHLRLVPFGLHIVRAVWSGTMPLANTPAVFNLLDGPVGVDPALHVIWVRFRMMRRYLACCPDEEPGMFRMLDLISGEAPGRGPVHLLLISAAEIGFAWDGDERGWVRPSLPPLGLMTGPIQHFFSSILDAWRCRVLAKLAEREGFRRVQFADFKGSLQLLCSSRLRDRDKMLLRAILCGGVWNGFLLGRAKKEDVPRQFCGKKVGDGHLFWECTFPPLLHVRELPEFCYFFVSGPWQVGSLPAPAWLVTWSQLQWWWGPLGCFFWSAGLHGAGESFGCLSNWLLWSLDSA